MPGVLLYCLAHQAHRGAPWLGSYSVVQCVRRLMGQPLYCSAASADVWGKREATVMAPPPTRDSAVLPCFHSCLAFLHWHFPPQSHPLHVGDLGSIPGSGKSPGEENGNPLQYSCLENSMDRGAWRAIVHCVAKESDTTEQITHTHTH